MKKLFLLGMAGLGLIGVLLTKGYFTNMSQTFEASEIKSLRMQTFPNAQAVVQILHHNGMRVSVEELKKHIAELDQIIESSNLIEKLNGNDLDEATRVEFYQVIEAKQTLLNELVQREIEKSKELVGRSEAL